MQNRQNVEQLSEHLDVQAILSRGIRVGYTPEVLTDAGALLLPANTILVDCIVLSCRHLCYASTNGRENCSRNNANSQRRQGMQMKY
jgi:hypothetical protein